MATEGDGELGQNLRTERVRRGHTQKTLGAILDLGRGTIAAIENDKVSNPGVYTLYGIAAALGVPMEDLMGVPRVTRTTKGRSQARALERARRAMASTDDESLADVAAEIAERAEAIKAAPYELPDAEDWAMWTDPTGLPLDEAVAVGEAYAEDWEHHSEANTRQKMSGGVVFGLAIGAAWMMRRLAR